MGQRSPILGEIAYPQAVGGVPTNLFVVNSLISGSVMLVLRYGVIGKLSTAMYVGIAVFAVIHLLIWRRWTKDPHIEMVWMASILPPDFTRPGLLRFVRQRTKTLAGDRGRRYEV